MSLQKVDRISILCKRKPGISEDEFHNYWANHHGPLCQELLCKYGIIKYNQFHITPEYKDKLAAFGVQAPSYDGMAEFLVHRFEDMVTFFTAPEYLEKIRPDELKFVDQDTIIFLAGVDYVVVDNNKPVVHKGDSAFSDRRMKNIYPSKL
ncbi:uncharacterized protein Z518_08140 [Rhinocladiella mackenziei CBS 650.93]|uniref:EthD domain-containing protein n=1 Tax=Rhinocladiella mackenziei CBS 650.93 TaxID=1442369 RepID=A0A0D2IG04_9EURO|nr:uncharacterized protein Z518_08140 [Rhinocladiella mackenziei CBS 650.93]KIX02201.1 hypothetical protein Z518_08140 [Rhinocladiella mackenziei CBS 650.93]